MKLDKSATLSSAEPSSVGKWQEIGWWERKNEKCEGVGGWGGECGARCSLPFQHPPCTFTFLLPSLCTLSFTFPHSPARTKLKEAAMEKRGFTMCVRLKNRYPRGIRVYSDKYDSKYSYQSGLIDVLSKTLRSHSAPLHIHQRYINGDRES